MGSSNSHMKFPAEKNYPKYTKHDSLVSRHMTPAIYAQCYKKVTPNGVTIDKCIQPSIDNTNKILGLVAGDEDCYEYFKALFDPVIDEKHLGFGPGDKHPAPDLEPAHLTEADLDDKYVKSCRIRTGRSVRGLRLPPCIDRAERREVVRCVTEALAQLTGDLAGKYYPLSDMAPEDEKRLIEDHFLFQKPTGHLMVNSGAVRDWPDGRGIWHTDNKKFLVWINEEDHVRLISMQQGGNMQATFELFCRALNEVEQQMKVHGAAWQHSSRLGYITTCPSNIGTGIRCSVLIQLHKLAKDPRFDDIVEALEMQKRGSAGEHTDAVDDTFDLSNAARLKKTECEFIQLVVNGVHKIIAMEKALEKGESIDDMIPKAGGAEPAPAAAPAVEVAPVEAPPAEEAAPAE